MEKKIREEIPKDLAAEVQFLSDRTCCVCRKPGRAIQIHHIDENPSNNVLENLAVLCLDCHQKTQVKGGFDRKLDAAQVKLYRDDWHTIIKQMRESNMLDKQNINRTSNDNNLSKGYIRFLKTDIENTMVSLKEYRCVRIINPLIKLTDLEDWKKYYIQVLDLLNKTESELLISYYRKITEFQSFLTKAKETIEKKGYIQGKPYMEANLFRLGKTYQDYIEEILNLDIERLINKLEQLAE